jgi:hypothetical protein
MVSKLLYLGSQPNMVRILSGLATTQAGSPGRRWFSITGKSTPLLSLSGYSE